MVSPDKAQGPRFHSKPPGRAQGQDTRFRPGVSKNLFGKGGVAVSNTTRNMLASLNARMLSEKTPEYPDGDTGHTPTSSPGSSDGDSRSEVIELDPFEPQKWSDEHGEYLSIQVDGDMVDACRDKHGVWVLRQNRPSDISHVIVEVDDGQFEVIELEDSITGSPDLIFQYSQEEGLTVKAFVGDKGFMCSLKQDYKGHFMIGSSDDGIQTKDVHGKEFFEHIRGYIVDLEQAISDIEEGQAIPWQDNFSVRRVSCKQDGNRIEGEWDNRLKHYTFKDEFGELRLIELEEDDEEWIVKGTPKVTDKFPHALDREAHPFDKPREGDSSLKGNIVTDINTIEEKAKDWSIVRMFDISSDPSNREICCVAEFTLDGHRQSMEMSIKKYRAPNGKEIFTYQVLKSGYSTGTEKAQYYAYEEAGRKKRLEMHLFDNLKGAIDAHVKTRRSDHDDKVARDYGEWLELDQLPVDLGITYGKTRIDLVPNGIVINEKNSPAEVTLTSSKDEDGLYLTFTFQLRKESRQEGYRVQIEQFDEATGECLGRAVETGPNAKALRRKLLDTTFTVTEFKHKVVNKKKKKLVTKEKDGKTTRRAVWKGHKGLGKPKVTHSKMSVERFLKEKAELYENGDIPVRPVRDGGDRNSRAILAQRMERMLREDFGLRLISKPTFNKDGSRVTLDIYPNELHGVERSVKKSPPLNVTDQGYDENGKRIKVSLGKKVRVELDDIQNRLNHNQFIGMLADAAKESGPILDRSMLTQCVNEKVPALRPMYLTGNGKAKVESLMPEKGTEMIRADFKASLTQDGVFSAYVSKDPDSPHVFFTAAADEEEGDFTYLKGIVTSQTLADEIRALNPRALRPLPEEPPKTAY